MLHYISPEAQRSLSEVPGFSVDPEMPSMTPYQAGLVPKGGFPMEPDLVMTRSGPRLGIITPDVTRELGMPVILGIPLTSWLTVASLSAAGGAAGAYATTKSQRGILGGTLGGLVGGLLGVAVVSLINRPSVSMVA